ncbi:MAG: oligosaccharide flippase family protein, partial [Rubrivivax sp.]|nr:oligosaccharide flippase family protein [Rubrivivax sp.]
MHFLTGKAVSGMLTLIILLLLVRVLTVEEYGIYVILVAGMELLLAVTSLGLPWTVARYLPEFRLRASGKMLAHFVWQAMALISLFLVIGILLLL